MFCAAFVGLIVRAIKFRRNKDKKILASNKQKLLMEETELQQEFFFFEILEPETVYYADYDICINICELRKVVFVFGRRQTVRKRAPRRDEVVSLFYLFLIDAFESPPLPVFGRMSRTL
jgi:hypothetical protein